MDRASIRTGAATIALMLAFGGGGMTLAGPAVAQNSTVVPLPGLDRFSLPPGNSQLVPTPVPSPTATPTPVPTPSPAPPQPTPATPRPTSTPVAGTTTPTPTPVTQATPTPAVTPTSAPPALPPVAVPSPSATAAVPAPAASPTGEVLAPAEPSGEGSSVWPFVLAGIAALGAGGYALHRRRSAAREEPVAYVDPPAAAPTPAAPPTPATASTPPIAGPAAAPPAAPQPARGIALDFRPRHLWTRGPDAFLAFDLLVSNTGTIAADGIRPFVALASASPGIAAEIASFESGVPSLSGGDAFDLRPGERRHVAGELTLRGDMMHVTEVAGRELIVPVALVSVTWRGGLSVATASDAFVIGTGDPTSAKLGPIWVDRAGLEYRRLDARRFTARA